MFSIAILSITKSKGVGTIRGRGKRYKSKGVGTIPSKHRVDNVARANVGVFLTRNSEKGQGGKGTSQGCQWVNSIIYKTGLTTNTLGAFLYMV